MNMLWRDVRGVEGARLEIVYTSKGYRGFKSHSLRQVKHETNPSRVFAWWEVAG